MCLCHTLLHVSLALLRYAPYRFPTHKRNTVRAVVTLFNQKGGTHGTFVRGGFCAPSPRKVYMLTEVSVLLSRQMDAWCT
jgi:hypothetical protein